MYKSTKLTKTNERNSRQYNNGQNPTITTKLQQKFTTLDISDPLTGSGIMLGGTAGGTAGGSGVTLGGTAGGKEDWLLPQAQYQVRIRFEE